MRLCWCAAVLVAITGCWQEVHYKPDKPLVLTPVINDLPAETDEAQDKASAPQNSPTDEPTDTPGNVTADELFGPPEAVISAADAIAPADSEEPTEQTADEQTTPETQEQTDAIAELPSELPTIPDTTDPLDTSADPSPVETSGDAVPNPTIPEVMRPSKTALAVWRMSSRWSFAAAIYAKGQPEDRYSDSLEQATYAAELVGLELPAFPVSEGITLETAVIGYLLEAGSSAFVSKLGDDYVPEYEALAELAIRTNALLLVYTPKSQQLDPLILSIRQAAENSGLPAELWMDLISMLERREPFADVKQSVLTFHTEIGEYLAGQQ